MGEREGEEAEGRGREGIWGMLWRSPLEFFALPQNLLETCQRRVSTPISGFSHRPTSRLYPFRCSTSITVCTLPRGVKSPLTLISSGSQAATRSSKIWLTDSSWEM